MSGTAPLTSRADLARIAKELAETPGRDRFELRLMAGTNGQLLGDATWTRASGWAFGVTTEWNVRQHAGAISFVVKK